MILSRHRENAIASKAGWKPGGVLTVFRLRATFRGSAVEPRSDPHEFKPSRGQIALVPQERRFALCGFFQIPR
jgi:hypothetical protein